MNTCTNSSSIPTPKQTNDNDNTNNTNKKSNKIKILTVGDGDLTFSLALKRAYPSIISMTASTLLESSHDLIQTYSNASDTMHELQHVWKEDVLFGVDATRLEYTLPLAIKEAKKGKMVGVVVDPSSSSGSGSGSGSSSSSSTTTSTGNLNDGNDDKDSNMVLDKDEDEDEEKTEDSGLKYDVIIFNHPHLGDAALHESEKLHAQRHHSLLCHYFHSAKKLIAEDTTTTTTTATTTATTSRIHVCLCGTQPQTWKLMDAAKRHGFICSKQEKTASPIHAWLFNDSDSDSDSYDDGNNNNGNNNGGEGEGEATTNLPKSEPKSELELELEPAQVQSHYRAPRRYRNGKLGSKHFLGKYGYRHRRTRGNLFNGNESDMMVEQSINFVFQYRKNHDDDDDDISNGGGDIDSKSSPSKTTLTETAYYQCDICGMSFSSMVDLDSHLQSPATPDVMMEEVYNDKLQHRQQLEGAVKKKTKYADNIEADSSNQQSNVANNNNNNNNNAAKTVYSQNMESSIIGDKRKLAEACVEANFNGKRLRWCCRQDGFPISLHVKSKKHCETLITSGRIYVNDYLALDSGRVLKTGDNITLIDNQNYDHGDQLKTSKSTLTKEKVNNHGVEIVKVIPSTSCDEKSKKIIIAFKPVGIRTVGTFSSQTLEMIVSNLMAEKESSCAEVRYESMTKLDTGCAGLCVLVSTLDKNNIPTATIDKEAYGNKFDVNYEFTALVHGSVPSDWDNGVYVKIPKSGLRRWKNKKKDVNSDHPLDGSCCDLDEKSQNNVEEEIIEISQSLKTEGDWVLMKCKERFNYNIETKDQTTSHLSTVVMKSNFESGRLSNLLCFLLRKAKYPVVNDRFCRRELSTLPRIMRNILKSKLCIGCYSLNLTIRDTDEKVEANVEPQCRTLCSYWQKTIGSTHA